MRKSLACVLLILAWGCGGRTETLPLAGDGGGSGSPVGGYGGWAGGGTGGVVYPAGGSAGWYYGGTGGVIVPPTTGGSSGTPGTADQLACRQVLASGCADFPTLDQCVTNVQNSRAMIPANCYAQFDTYLWCIADYGVYCVAGVATETPDCVPAADDLTGCISMPVNACSVSYQPDPTGFVACSASCSGFGAQCSYTDIGPLYCQCTSGPSSSTFSVQDCVEIEAMTRAYCGFE
jgi:hypothetical protein